ncbi:MAG: DNA repair protein RecN [Nitrospirae bacterium]|nr:DNA repair protein RecN [Nitrospirota bacterium]
MIKNLAIIDDLRVRFENGFNVLTGETGAGKSIIVDSLGLALGSRAQTDLIRTGEKDAVVQAFFEVENIKELSDMDIDTSEGLILRRNISASGKSRAYINDTMVSLQSLSEIGRTLVDIHGQHEPQSLLTVDKHIIFIDLFGRLYNDREKVKSLYKEVQTLRQEESNLRQKARERSHRLDLLRFQINEIDAASLSITEKGELTEERNILLNMSRLKESGEKAYCNIYSEEGSCIEKLTSVITKVKEMSSVDQRLSEVLSLLEAAMPLIEDASFSLRGYKDKFNPEPERLAEVEDRLEFIKRLERKYGEGIENILIYRDGAEKELKSLEIIDERLDTIEAECKEKEDMLLQSAIILSEKRKEVAQELEGLVKNELKELAFSDAEFVIDVKQEPVSTHGIDKIEFLFSANPGEPPKPLAKIASGGELSRVMLALKSIFADFDSIPVMIFDEVDAGIGGKTAKSVGKKLKAISHRHQVLCTTHLPQIASMGDFHLKVEKGQKNERVCVEVKELKGGERINEIARMLSGKITEVSLRHAKELLESAT